MGNVVRGLVPRWGGGGAWQNPPCQFAVPSHNSSFSYLRVPAATGTSDWHESMSRTPIRDEVTRPRVSPHSTAPPFVIPAPFRHSGEGRNPEGWGEGNVVRSKTTRGEGLVPRWGGGGAWHRRHLNPSINQCTQFSSLGVPAPAGMSDWYESMSRTPIRGTPWSLHPPSGFPTGLGWEEHLHPRRPSSISYTLTSAHVHGRS